MWRIHEDSASLSPMLYTFGLLGSFTTVAAPGAWPVRLRLRPLCKVLTPGASILRRENSFNTARCK